MNLKEIEINKNIINKNKNKDLNIYNIEIYIILKALIKKKR